MTNSVIEWASFNVFIGVARGLDLGVFSRSSHVIHVREAMVRSAVWVALAFLFAGYSIGGGDTMML